MLCRIEMLIDFITGKSNRVWYLLFIILFWFLWGLISYIAAQQFLVPYNLLNNHVSNLGGIAHNPYGHQLWNNAMIIMGICSIPYYAFIYQYFKSNWPVLSKWMLGFGISCAIGFSLVGLFPEDIVGLHQLGAVMNFVGIPSLAGCIQYIVVKNSKLVQSWKLITLLNIFLFIIFTTMLLIFRLDEWFGLSYPPEPRIFDFPIWEWSYFFMVITWMIGILIPLNNNKSH